MLMTIAMLMMIVVAIMMMRVVMMRHSNDDSESYVLVALVKDDTRWSARDDEIMKNGRILI